MRGVTQRDHHEVDTPNISTHTPHARRDRVAYYGDAGSKNFNSHASCEA